MAEATSALALLAGTASAGISPSYRLLGVEVQAASTVGTFVGSGTGQSGEVAGWKGVVKHTSLSTRSTNPAAVTGGNMTLTSLGTGGKTTVKGTFTGGSIAYDTTRSRPGCGNQVFQVIATIGNITSGTQTETGLLRVALTHHRRTIFGHCIIYAATLTGTISFSLS